MDFRTQFARRINESIELKQQLLSDEPLMTAVVAATDAILHAFRSGNKVLFAGNGGSAADAQHLAAEFSGRFYLDRKALPAEALHCNTSYLTAVANDYSFGEIYARLVGGIGVPGDVLVGMSTSGNSANVVSALKVGREIGLVTVGMTGRGGGAMASLSDVLVEIPSTDPPRIQECHMLLGHTICELVEAAYFAKA